MSFHVTDRGTERIERVPATRALFAIASPSFRDKQARKALATLKQTSRATRMKALLVEALAVLVPAQPTFTVCDCARLGWSQPQHGRYESG